MTTTEPTPHGVGGARLERCLAILAGVFTLLYSLQALDSLIADWPGMAGPAGGVAVALVALSVALAAAAVGRRVPGRAALLGATIAYGAALLVWPLALAGPISTDSMPWFAAVAGGPAACCAVAVRRPGPTVAASFAAAGWIGGVLVLRGGSSIADALVNSLFVVVFAVVLVLLVAALRHAVRQADAAQQAALAGFGRTALDDATEAERVRTDALVHDCVLTTFLAAASAPTPETEDLAARMAANALRVLQHVNRDGFDGPIVAFTRAVAEAEARLAPLAPYFAVHADEADGVVVPVEVADAILDAMVQAMTSSVQHVGATDRSVRMTRLGPDGVRVVVADDGEDPPGSADLRASIEQRLREVDGRADLASAPGSGCTVVLSWGSVVIHGVTPLSAAAVPA